ALGSATLPSLARGAGLTPVLMTDEAMVSGHPLAGEFDQHVSIIPHAPRRGRGPVAHLEDTHFAACFAQLVDWLDRGPGDFFLWCHLGGLGTIWDAPIEYREAYCEAGDPPPYRGMVVPRRILSRDHDPDELFGLVQAYSGQVTLLDACLGGLLGLLDESRLGEETALAVLGARGFPLGEHLQVGVESLPLHGELVQTSAMVRLPDGCGAAARSHELVQPADLAATLLDLAGAPVPDLGGPKSLLPIIRDHLEPTREYVLLAGDDKALALRTPAWYYRQADPPELFVKPDDRWEANNVASRCVDVMEQLGALSAQSTQAFADRQYTQIAHLPDILVRGLE
ncbi:MAG: sulfatase-like hydrolase/transferase, partial [Patescibacteria group bacterium]|nr:sulfatase-like hydrolase/transferase [Patescibacteria group bacterium]